MWGGAVRAILAMSKYKEQIIQAMHLLAEDPRVLFIGQNVKYGGAIAIEETLKDIPDERKLELPIAEDFQVGFCLGLSLMEFVPVCVLPRMDFLIIAANQIVNHLDKMKEMSAGQFRPKVIVRTCIGAKNPLNPGPQHTGDYTKMLWACLANIDVVKLEQAEDIVPAYRAALESERSTILIEIGERMRG